jgi:MFS family permease
MGGRVWSVGAVLAAGLLAEFAYALLLFPLLQHDLVFNRGLSAAWPGYALAAYGVARLATQVPLGGVADRLSRWLAVTIGYLVVLIGGLLLWLHGPAVLLLVAAAVFGVGHAFADPLLPAALSDGVGHDARGRVIGLLNLTQVAGLVGGLAGGAFVVDLAPASTGFVLVAAANGLALLLLAIGAAPLLAYRPARKQRASLRATLAVLLNERAIDIFIVLFLLSLAMNVVMPNIDVYAVRRLGESLHELVPYLLPAGVLGVAALPLGGWLSDRYGRVPPLLLGVTLALIGFAQLGLTHSLVGAAIGAALAGAGLALTMPSSNVAVLDVADVQHRALLLSGMMAVQGLGQSAGPLLGGVIAQTRGTAASFIVAAIILWLCIPATVLFAAAPHDGEPGEVVPYTPLTRLISRLSLRVHAARRAERERRDAVAAGSKSPSSTDDDTGEEGP